MPTTVDELYDVLVAFRDKDPNGNGLKDEVPMIGRDNTRDYDVLGFIINAYIQYMPTYKGIIEDGKVTTPYIEDEYREALKYINKLIKEGLLSPMTFSATKTDIKSLMNVDPGEALTVGVISFPVDETLDLNNPAIYDYEPMPVLKAETERGGYGMWYADTWNYPCIVNANVERPEIVFRLLDFMTSAESYLRLRWGERGVDWDWLPENVDGTGKSHLGDVAKIQVYNQNTFIEANNSTWHAQYSFCSEPYYGMYVEPGVDPWKDEMYSDMRQMKQYYIDAGQPEEMLYIFDRTEEEEATFQEFNSEITDLTNRARAQFAVGQRDPYSDDAWNAYLAELEQLNIQECWLGVMQSSYDRYVASKG